LDIRTDEDRVSGMAGLFRDVARGVFAMQHGRFAMRKTCCWGVRVCSVALLIAVFMSV
jgi:hypothetical protein